MMSSKNNYKISLLNNISWFSKSFREKNQYIKNLKIANIGKLLGSKNMLQKLKTWPKTRLKSQSRFFLIQLLSLLGWMKLSYFYLKKYCLFIYFVISQAEEVDNKVAISLSGCFFSKVTIIFYRYCIVYIDFAVFFLPN